MPNVEELGFSRIHRKETAQDSQSLEEQIPLSSVNQVFGDNSFNGSLIESLSVNKLTAGTLRIGSYILGGATGYNNGTGFFLGDEDSSNTWKFFIGNSAGNKLTWDGTTLSITGSITATTGSIGGFDIGSDYIRDVGNSFGLASTVTGGDDVRFWAGAAYASRSSAPFRVTEAGVVTASSGTIGGFTLGATTLTATNLTLDSSGQRITLGTTNDVVILDADDATYRLWAGNATAASAPFSVSKAGALVATSATITGSITSTSGTIGGFTIGATTITATNLTLDSANQRISLGSANDIIIMDADDATYRLWIGNATAASAPFSVSKAGALIASSATVTGAITTSAGSSINGTYLTSNSVASASVNLAMRGWTQTSVFSITDADTVSWGSGTFTASDGTAYSISAGNTGNMAAKTYIYLDTGVSTTAYQTTTTASTAVGNSKVLIATAQNGTTEPTFMLMNDNSYNIDAANIVAGSITANEIAAATITATKMSVSQLSAIAADLGAITAGTIVLPSGGFMRSGQTAYDTGTGFYIGNDSGTPKFSLGNSSGNKLTWDGTTLSITGSISVSSIPNLPGDENLWARWGMDEGSGTSIIDLSGNSRTGTSVGTTYATGKAGQALSFNSTDYVTLPSTGMPTSALTVSVWVKADSHASSRRIIWNNWSVAGDWIIYSDATNWIFGIKSSGPTDQLITYAHSSDTSSWHHLVGTYDGTTQRFYVDGTEVGTALTHTTTLSTGGTFRLSHDAFDSFAGSIDEVRVYSTAITVTNVKGLYSNPSAVSTSGIITAKSGLIGGFTIGASSITAVSGGNTTTVSSGSTAFSAGPTGSPTFSVTQAGALTSTSGAIGGFDLGTDYIRDAGNSFGLASTVTGGDDTRFWAGDSFTNRATAPFRVTESGALYATSATISGSLTAKTTFTAGEALLSGDVVYISSTDTVKRCNPDSISSNDIDVTANTAASMASTGKVITIDLSDTVKVVVCEGNPTTGSGGVTHRVRAHNAITGAETQFFGATADSGTGILSWDAVKISSDKILITYLIAGVTIRGIVYSGLSGTSSSSVGAFDVDTTSLLNAGCGCAYISDSHVLFFSQNTSGTSSVQFHKCTLSGTTLSASSSGTVSTIGGDSFVLLGARQLGTTNYFIFFIQNTTDAVAQCFVAHYDTGSSTFDSVGSIVDFTGGQDFDTSEEQLIISLDDTHVMCAFRTSATDGKYFAVSVSGTTPTIGTLYSMQTGGGGGETYCLSKINSRSAFLCIQQNGPVDIRLLEYSGDGTTIVEKITVDTNDWVLDTSPCLLSFFQLNPSRYLIIYSSNGTHDFYRESGPYQQTKYPVGICESNVASGASVVITTGGYTSGVSNLTATYSYFMDTGGALTTNAYGTGLGKRHILEAKDTTEAIINIS